MKDRQRLEQEAANPTKAPNGTTLNYGTSEAEDVKNPDIARPPNGMMKTQSSFGDDLKNFAEGTVPQSIIVALTIGKFHSLDWNIIASNRIASSIIKSYIQLPFLF